MSSSTFVQDAIKLVSSFPNGRQLSAVFNTAVNLADDRALSLAEKQSRLSTALAVRQDIETSQFSILYGASLHRLGLAEEANITYIKWADLLPDADLEETVDAIAGKLDKAFAANQKGLIVITNAYESPAKTDDEKQAVKALEAGLRLHMAAHPLVLLAGKSGPLRNNIDKKNEKLVFGQKVGL